MKVGYRQQILFPVRDPLLSGKPLALWAVTISAGIVADAGMTAFITAICMGTQPGSSAKGNRGSNLQILQGEPVSLKIRRSKLLEYILHFNSRVGLFIIHLCYPPVDPREILLGAPCPEPYEDT